MKPSINGGDLLRNPTLIKISAFLLISFTFFYLGKHWSDDASQQLIFFSTSVGSSPMVSIAPYSNLTFNLSALIPPNQTEIEVPVTPPPSTSPVATEPVVEAAETPPPPPPQVGPIRSFGIVDDNGVMSDNFEVGELDNSLMEDWGNQTEIEAGKGDGESRVRVRVKKFGMCPEKMREYIPCLDNVEAIKKLKSTERGERFERHCPEQGKALNCLVPPPKGYRPRIPWPRSRDEVWFNNVPHTRLVEDKGGQNWIFRDKDKFKFPGGGTQFIHGAEQYLDQISKMISEIKFGKQTRVALDVGCGVASFGAYLLTRDVLTLSVAPKDVHENQIQFALERGVPAMVAAFATRRLLYPSQAFDLIHCSRCRINWTRDDGILLVEVNRMLRSGGYFAWAAQPVYKHEAVLEEQWTEMLNLTDRLCWKLVKKEGYIAIWQKPFDNSCYLSREDGTKPPLCDADDDPDNVWYTSLKPCITRIPENGYGGNITSWPARLHTPPDRLQTIKLDSLIARKELLKAESKFWNEMIGGYIRAFKWKKMKLRNVLDMRAGYGGFAAALIDHKLDCWVLNVVPVSGPNTLPVIYDRGLLGVMHDWCEPFDTYPRTYDLLHASGLFSIERKRCNISTIMLEMDRILRPGGRAYIRDSIDVMDELQEIAKAMGWHTTLRFTSEGPHASYRILTCEKRLPRA
ncbi:PREDICTED: probable methyltransferase PMT11 [Tarenaya hassleriana]|uniref:probable methyltransferase PMT11 n=1 Tax=Tarenaya hassleriana TaxID=28532 RepID=UPI00053C733B|nr:PREDICTED: probable methyltransferase PMT11 [Tarenaya hassleriana]